VQFLQRIVAGDGRWVHHVTPETKQASMTWKRASCTPAKKRKTTQSAKKIMATVFWDHKGVLHVDFLTQGDKVKADRYCDTMSRLREAIRRKRPGFLRRGVVLLHDNARQHTDNHTRELLRRYKWEVLDQPPYSPDLAPSDFFISLDH
jgi:histone-lysine N-methyltransferase SETMAR